MDNSGHKVYSVNDNSKEQRRFFIVVVSLITTALLFGVYGYTVGKRKSERVINNIILHTDEACSKQVFDIVVKSYGN